MISRIWQTYKPHTVPFGVLILISIVCFAPARGHEFISSWDDYWYVLNNEAVRGFSSYHLKTAFSSYFVGNYAPLQIISYMIDYELWGLQPSGFITSNILLHTINGLMLYGIVFQLQRSRIRATIASFLFLFHPVQIESVVWISQRKNVLAMLFFLLALICYQQYQKESGIRSKSWYIASLLQFLCALLTKSVAVVFPLVLIVYDCAYGSDKPERYRNKIPYVIIAAAAALLTLESQVSGRSGWHGGSPLTTLFTMFPVAIRYLVLILWPAHLSPMYNPPIKSALDTEVAAATALLFLAGVAAVYIYRHRRELFFWYTLFFIALLPVCQIVPIITLMNDRYLYFPMLGAAVCIATLPATLLSRQQNIQRIAGALFVVALLPMPYLSLKQSAVWQDAISLWSHAVKQDPGSDKARKILAEALLLRGVDRSNEGKSAEALKLYLQALEYDPTNTDILTSIVAQYHMLGNELEAGKYSLRFKN